VLGPKNLEPEVATSSRQGVMALVEAINGLPPRCRMAFMLNRFDGLSYAEVAARMGISIKMVEQHIKNALDACARSRAHHVGCGGTSTGTCYRAAGLVQSQGWEFEVAGKPSPRWDIVTGYTYNQAKYLADSTASNVGTLFARPVHMFKLWSQYHPGGIEGVASAWTLGAGMYAQSEITNGALSQGGYATFNARVAYRIDKNWEASLNFNNLTDRTYLRTVGYTGYYNSYGDPRNMLLTVRAKF
jgi:outer membrane receptor for ferric coprogen and ferric-rhodotorulic acid